MAFPAPGGLEPDYHEEVDRRSMIKWENHERASSSDRHIRILPVANWLNAHQLSIEHLRDGPLATHMLDQASTSTSADTQPTSRFRRIYHNVVKTTKALERLAADGHTSRTVFPQPWYSCSSFQIPLSPERANRIAALLFLRWRLSVCHHREQDRTSHATGDQPTGHPHYRCRSHRDAHYWLPLKNREVVERRIVRSGQMAFNRIRAPT